jgi:hypothetical protein
MQQQNGNMWQPALSSGDYMPKPPQLLLVKGGDEH